MSAESTVKAGGFSREALVELTWPKNEPQWLKGLREEAWRIWETTPMPSRKDEEWRRTDISMLDLAAILPPLREDPDGQIPSERPIEARALSDEGELQEGLLARRGSRLAFAVLPEEIARNGVIFTDLESAIRDHGDLVRAHLGTQIPPAYGKFQALHGAFWSGGTFLYVPRNVEVSVPLRSFTWSDTAGVAVMPRTLVVLEEGASAALVDEYASADGSGPALANAGVELVLGQGAVLRYISLQRWGAGAIAFTTQRAIIGRDAHLTTLSVVLGSRVTKSWIESLLAEQGASAEMVGIMFARGRQRFHHHTLQDHRAPNTTSDLLFKAVLADEARSEYSGMIKVRKDAQKADAYQANRNLALSEHARADSMPKLEIEANDVRCTHGATVGPIDPEQIFYLMSRGLPRSFAERMIVEGFFEQVMEKIPLEGIRETVRKAVAEKLEAR